MSCSRTPPSGRFLTCCNDFFKPFRESGAFRQHGLNADFNGNHVPFKNLIIIRFYCEQPLRRSPFRRAVYVFRGGVGCYYLRCLSGALIWEIVLEPGIARKKESLEFMSLYVCEKPPISDIVVYGCFQSFNTCRLVRYFHAFVVAGHAVWKPEIINERSYDEILSVGIEKKSDSVRQVFIFRHAASSCPACANQDRSGVQYSFFIQVWCGDRVDKFLFSLSFNDDVQAFHSCPPIMFFSHRSLIVRL